VFTSHRYTSEQRRKARRQLSTACAVLTLVLAHYQFIIKPSRIY
jgi:hypothetical protein